MAFFDELGKSISGAGQSAVKQAKDVADITRLSALLSENKSQISVINRQIGEKYFELFREAAGDEFTELVEKEKELLAEILHYEENEAKVPDYITTVGPNDLIEILER